jgi:hypothetical protein
MSDAAVEVGRDRCVAVVGEPQGRLLVPLVPAGHVMEEHDARKRARPRRTREVGVNRVAAVAENGHGLGEHPLVLVGRNHFERL